MDNSDKPKFLAPELEQRRKLLFRYYHSYSKAYHETLWQLEEVKLLVRNLEHSNHNMWMLNEALYNYAEASISALNWLLGVKDYPFVHWFLREWRNEYHHQEKVDFQLNDFVFHVGEEPYELKDDYFIFPMVAFNERLKNLLRKYFGTDKVATDATVNGLVANHHDYMRAKFLEYESNLNSEMPKSYLVHNSQSKRALVGTKFEEFFPESEFWKGRTE